MKEDKEVEKRAAMAEDTKQDTESRKKDDMRSYIKEYPDFSEALKGRRITLREC